MLSISKHTSLVLHHRSRNMSQRLRQFAPLLRKLHKSSRKTQLNLLKKNFSKEFIHCLCECCLNMIKGNVKLNKAQKSRLLRQRKYLRKFMLKKTSLAKKRKIVQKGGFLGAILSPIISILGGLFGNRQQ